ncbi:hypothetical protein [Nocardia sp. GAS34]
MAENGIDRGGGDKGMEKPRDMDDEIVDQTSRPAWHNFNGSLTFG